MKKLFRQPAARAAKLPLGVVALVDDDIQVAKALDAWFGLGGLQTLHYCSSESLLQAIGQIHESPTLAVGANPSRRADLVAAVLDLNLPGLSGFELAAVLRSRFPRLPLVIITALREDDRLALGSSPPGITCLQKPFDLCDLDQALFPTVHANLPPHQECPA
ncbi:MAG: response regulator [Betaproteobacteria bacterium]